MAGLATGQSRLLPPKSPRFTAWQYVIILIIVTLFGMVICPTKQNINHQGKGLHMAPAFST